MMKLDTAFQSIVVKNNNEATLVVDLATETKIESPLPTHKSGKYDLFLAEDIGTQDREAFVRAGNFDYKIGMLTNCENEFEQFIKLNKNYSFIGTCTEHNGETVLIAATNTPSKK